VQCRKRLEGQRATEEPLAVWKHSPHLEVALPLHTLVPDLAGHDVARACHRGVFDGDEMKRRGTRARGTELEPGAPPGPSPARTTPPSTAVRDQSIVSSCAATERVATRIAIPALASTCLMSTLLLLTMGFKERVERLGVEQPVRVGGTEPQLERTGVRRSIEQLDLLD